MTDEVKGFRGLSPRFLAALERLTDDPMAGAWWRDVLARGDLVIAVRKEALNVYYRGASLFQVELRDGVLIPCTHAKYLSRRRQGPVVLHARRFDIDPTTALWREYGQDTLLEMMAAAANLAGPEKIGLHSLLIASPHVIDVEIALGSVGDGAESADGAILAAEESGEDPMASLLPERGRQDRLDVATVHLAGDTLQVVFHEAKHFSNSELRAGPDKTPKVAGQIERYRRTLARRAPELSRSYRDVACALVRIDAMRSRITASSRPLDPVIRRMAEGSTLPEINPEPRLVIFGFDRDQRDGPVWQQHQSRLTQPPPAGFGLSLTAFGATAGRREAAFR